MAKKSGSKPLTKTEIMRSISETTGLQKKDVVAVMEALTSEIQKALKGSGIGVFSIPGLGRLMASAILTRDYPLIQGGLLLTAAMFVGINLLVDVLYAFLDPRVRYD